MIKRVLKWFVLPVVLIVGILVGVANLLGEPGGTLPAPDPARLITLPDGRVEALGDLLARVAEVALAPAPEPTPAPTTTDAPSAEDEAVTSPPEQPVIDEMFPSRWPPELASDETDVFRLGQHAMREGRVEEALALLQSVPEDHDHFDTAQRFIGWELLTKEMDRPALGLAYMNRALNASPLEGENWQDASRVYLRNLGIRWDPVNNTMR